MVATFVVSLVVVALFEYVFVCLFAEIRKHEYLDVLTVQQGAVRLQHSLRERV